MKKRMIATLLASALLSNTGWAQEQGVWIQVEALPTLSRAQDRARAYDGRLPDVNGYALGTGWYGIALGPHPVDEARLLLRRLVASGSVPADAFIADGSEYRSRFWPIGAPQPAPAASVPVTAPVVSGAASTAVTAPEPAPAPAPEPVAAPIPDESPRQALESETRLSQSEKEKLQTALRWSGHYDGPIDAAFGRGTRSAMASWQGANGHEPTGILTSRQRSELTGAYDSVLDGLGLATVANRAAGIEIALPGKVVDFAKDEPPFSRYDPVGKIDAQVLLISQKGDRDRLAGLYEILQTLAIVPPEGPRSRRETGFVIEGADATRATHVEATLQDGEIKGFALVWPAGDEARRLRLVDEMKASFVRLPGTLDPAEALPDEDQAIDLVSGLEIRQPLREASGFFVDNRGAVATASAAIADCGDLAIDGVRGATVLRDDAASGLALLRPASPLAPLGVAVFQTAVPRIRDEVAVAGFPYGGALSISALTFGSLADIRGLGGEDTLKRLDLTAQPGDAGGPVFDRGGAVLGMLLPRQPKDGQVLPPEVGLALETDAILTTLRAAGIEPQTTELPADTTPELLTRRAAELTVLVSCWE